ncbi:hypothetical protein CVT25_007189 [Psilocybe cyanescens]|uniref:26S proteasome regulatory subunit Rpn6 N-terminal domain-containing protein n=1 Tax=Psilocybe cyanescens TaxID=93625 RepID=A0A409WVS4_PSICY|nr:hypothetical protein CVT25_007189 [Psilocybe cyanescens]
MEVGEGQVGEDEHREHHFILARASTLASTHPKDTEALYKQIIATSQSGEGLQDQEVVLVKLGELYCDQNYTSEPHAHCMDGADRRMDAHRYAEGVHVIHRQSQDFRTLLDYFAAIPEFQKMKALTYNIACAKKEKLIFLKHSLRRGLQFESRQYQPTLALVDTLLTELQRLDNKMILTKVHLLKSRVYHGLGNMPKAKVHFFLAIASSLPPSSLPVAPHYSHYPR